MLGVSVIDAAQGLTRHLTRLSDIKVGEKYVYVNSSLARLKESYPQAKVIMFYDIACKVDPHLQV